MNKDLVNGINSFFSLSYVPFILPNLLANTGINYEIIWFYSCLMLAILSMSATYLCKKSIIAGPSIAGITVISAGIIPTLTHTNDIIKIIMSTAFLLLIAVMLNLHKSLLEIISSRIRIGFRAGVALMFLLTAIYMLEPKDIYYFIILNITFLALKKYTFLPPIICVAATMFDSNISKFTIIKFNLLSTDWSMWDLNVISGIIVLFTTLLMDCTITANTLNPGKEGKSITIAATSSSIGAFLLGSPCGIYIETLIFSKEKNLSSAYICASLFLIISFLGSGLNIPNFIAATLLTQLAIKIFIATKPKLWLKKSPEIIIIMLTIGIFKSFLFGITIGLISEIIGNLYNNKLIQKLTIKWTTALTAASIFIL